MWEDFKSVNYNWVFLSITLSVMSHWARAWRWNMLLRPLGYQLKTYRTFLAVMVGYLANFVVPRMGEVTRCGILNKTDGVQVSGALGSVVTERVIDVICLLTALLAAFIIEFDTLNSFFFSFLEEKIDTELPQQASFAFTLIAIVAISITLILVISYYLAQRYKRILKRNKLYIKIRRFLRDMTEGVLSIRNLQSPWKFWLATLLIWVLYFYMSFVVVFAVKQTAHLGHDAGLAMLITGGLGMAAPVQGGIGAYHYLVSSVLVLYGIAQETGIFLAFLLHSSQTFMVIATGLISLVVSLIIPKRNALIKNETKH